jgi:hypothetical protein
MGEFKDSFNMFIGATDRSLDLEHNPYISIKVYGIDENYKLFEQDRVSLRRCEEADIGFVKKEARKFYPNSLCFNDRSKIVLHNNWFSDRYHNLAITVEHCRNTTLNGNKCKSPEVIDEYVSKTIFYL